MVYTILMQRKNIKTYFFLSIVLILSFVVDAIAKVVILQAPARVFWYSALGLVLLAMAFLMESSFLMTTTICVLFFIEGLWTLGFFYFLIFHGQVLQVSTYAFSVNFRDFSSFVTLYHLFFVPFIIYAYMHLKKVSRFGWLGAFFFALFAGVIAFMFAGGHDNINCVYSAATCIRFLEPFYKIPNPYRILVVVSVLTLFVYIPTNIILWELKRLK